MMTCKARQPVGTLSLPTRAGDSGKSASDMSVTNETVLSGMLALLLLPSLFCIPLEAVDGDAVLNKARASYYSLDALGLKAFQCTTVVAPQLIADSLKLSPRDPSIQFLADLRFAVSVDKHHKRTVTPYRASGREIDRDLFLTEADRLVVDDFFYLWGRMVLTNPFARFDASTVALEGLRSYRVLSIDKA
jgi:hypothetical protein